MGRYEGIKGRMGVGGLKSLGGGRGSRESEAKRFGSLRVVWEGCLIYQQGSLDDNTKCMLNREITSN